MAPWHFCVEVPYHNPAYLGHVYDDMWIYCEWFTFDNNKYIRRSVAHGTMGCGQKSFKLVWRCYQLMSGLLAKGH